MGRGVEKQALANSGTENKMAAGSNANATDIYSKLMPQYQAEATNPQGYSAGDLAAANTAGGQAVGGSVAGAVGQGNLTAARTRNAGGFAPALDAAAQSGMKQSSDNALGVQMANANMKQQNQQAGLAGEANLYGQNSGNALSAMGLSNNSLNAATGAAQQTQGTINAGINTAGKLLGVPGFSQSGVGG
jgi:hypothetical protein